MRNGQITENGGNCYPSFNFGHTAGEGYGFPEVTAQLTESIRNLLGEIQASQMLSCDTRSDIRRIRIALEKMARPKRRKRR